MTTLNPCCNKPASGRRTSLCIRLIHKLHTLQMITDNFCKNQWKKRIWDAWSRCQHAELFICNTLLKLTKMEENETKIKTYADTN